jgi:hypothetical protein
MLLKLAGMVCLVQTLHLESLVALHDCYLAPSLSRYVVLYE